ncbi:MAG TPA: zinc ribbon domain-containing protein [Gemmatimonadales bacterium]
MSDLERFFRRLVTNLASSDPARLHRPLPLTEVYQSIMPYRTNRRALGLDTSEDYELVLLRLAAGEGGFARTEPEEARASFAREASSTHPDLEILHRFENVLLSLGSDSLERVLGPAPELNGGSSTGTQDLPRPDLPAMTTSKVPPEPELPAPDAFPPTSGSLRCRHCGGALPLGRAINFCPYCGQNQALTHCPECRSELEAGWRHCVNCGALVAPK